MGAPGPAIEAGERAVAIADEVGDQQLWIVSRSHLGPALAARGDHRRATAILAECVERLRGELVGDAMGTTGILSVFTRIYLVCSLAELGAFDAALDHAESALKIAESRNHVYSLIFACYGLGTVFAMRGELERGIAALERGVELCRSWNLPLGMPLLATSLGHACTLNGRLDEAIAVLEEADRQAGVMTRLGGHAMLLVRLGEAYLRQHRLDDARGAALKALALSRTHTERGLEAYALRLLGELAVESAAESETFIRQALARAEELELRPLIAQCELNLGALDGRAGRPDSAQRHLAAAAALFRALEMPYWLAQAEAQLAG
jgi:tetratricopeptide (TPR) repeat protein